MPPSLDTCLANCVMRTGSLSPMVMIPRIVSITLPPTHSTAAITWNAFNQSYVVSASTAVF